MPLSPERTFPIQSQRGARPHPLQIPWHVAELAYSVYASRYGRGQSLQRLAERGGFGPGEMDDFLPDWRERCDEMTRLRDHIKELLVEVDRLREELAHHHCDSCDGSAPSCWEDKRAKSRPVA